ncbi:glycosyltransferase [Caenispirillum salinarum AK4]|uniref:Glycosyltransferase n=2 Tax=Caenispirillum TaxID=414051 RepID=K9HR72_9PROT|nr:glycosyltransferase [Caenispirillum salinarum AK4]
MLFQRTGGLQVQVRETLAALRALGADAGFMNPWTQALTDFDVIHLFGAINGNERVVQACNDAGVPVVLSSVLGPPFTRTDARRARTAAALAGRLTGWASTTSYRQIMTALHGADRVVALGRRERDMLADGYDVPAERLRVIPNGVPERFFQAAPDLFRRVHGADRRFLITAASISPYKGQLRVVRALAGLDPDIDYVMFGRVAREDRGYLEQCLQEGRGRVRYLGELPYDDPMLPSAYAAADLLVLPSQSEVMPLCVLEAMACGTPAVMTAHHGMDVAPHPGRLAEVEPTDSDALRRAVAGLVNEHEPGRVISAAVAGYSWTAVARQVLDVYREVAVAGAAVSA